MKLLYSGLVGIGRQQDPAVLAKAHKDGGLSCRDIMSLIYVQAAMDLEHMNGGLLLPPDFPDSWLHQTLIQQNDLMADALVELKLNPSKLQRDVSTTFTRIGFEHVEEHIITMEEMAEQGVNIALKPLGILSIDIANLEEKIAIEVDGPYHFISDIDEVHETSGHKKFIDGKLEHEFRWADRHHMSGGTALKHRVLTLLGWKVIHLPYWEWDALRGDEFAQDDYCRCLLRI
jgi:hypothetical protein